MIWAILAAFFFLLFFWVTYITPLPAAASSVGDLWHPMGFVACAFLCLAAKLLTANDEEEIPMMDPEEAGKMVEWLASEIGRLRRSPNAYVIVHNIERLEAVLVFLKQRYPQTQETKPS